MEDDITPAITIAMGYDTEASIDVAEINCRGIYLFILFPFIQVLFIIFCLVLYAYSVDMACQDKSQNLVLSRSYSFSYFVCFSYSVHIALPHSLLVLSSCCLFRILNLQLIPKGRQEWVPVRLTGRTGRREQLSHLMMIMHDTNMWIHALSFS